MSESLTPDDATTHVSDVGDLEDPEDTDTASSCHDLSLGGGEGPSRRIVEVPVLTPAAEIPLRKLRRSSRIASLLNIHSAVQETISAPPRKQASRKRTIKPAADKATSSSSTATATATTSSQSDSPPRRVRKVKHRPDMSNVTIRRPVIKRNIGQTQHGIMISEEEAAQQNATNDEEDEESS